MANVWIIHRETESRAAIARLAAVDPGAVQAGPGDPELADAAAPDVVLLGLADDFESELQFAHRFARRLPDARWILLCHRDDAGRVRELFDTLDCELLAWPPDARDLRAAVHAPVRPTGAGPLPLSQRPARDALSGRFARWFADLELPELLRILDPRLGDVPLLISGEPGCGRSLLARYVHDFGGTAGGDFLHLPCEPGAGPAPLLTALAELAARLRRPGAPGCVCLEDVDRLDAAGQRALAGWIEFGLPPGAPALGEVRWIATARDPVAGLEPALAQALGASPVAIPPLRERRPMIPAFVADTARAWCHARRLRARRFGDDALAALAAYPWPGNLRELEGVVEQTLLATSADPIRVGDLQHQGLAFAPRPGDEAEPILDAEMAETELLPSEDAAADPVAPAAPAEPAGDRPPAADGGGIGRLVGAVAHEVRNPLTTIRTFAELLPAHFDDPEFREQFRELVGSGVERIEEVVQELARMAALESPKPEPVDVAQLLEDLLERERETIHARRLLVLKELDRERPHALGDATQLRYALELLLRRCLALVPERGDVYFASKHHARGHGGAPSVRILVRFHGPGGEAAAGAPVPGLSPAENSLDFALAEAIARAQGGSLVIQAGEGDETVLLLDLPAPG